MISPRYARFLCSGATSPRWSDGCRGCAHEGDGHGEADHADGSPRTARLFSHDVAGNPTGDVAVSGSATVAVVNGGGITAADDDAPYLVSWLGLQPGDVLLDSQQVQPGIIGAATGSVTPHSAAIDHVPANVRLLRAHVAVTGGGMLLANAELSAMPSGGQASGLLDLTDGPADALVQRALILYLGNSTPEVPSSWIFDSAAGPASTMFDAERALPFIDHTTVTVDSARRLHVAWQPTAPLAGEVAMGKVLLTWHDGNAAPSTWEVRFPYAGDHVTLPLLPPDVTVARLPANTPTLQIFAEVALLDFTSSGAAQAFRRDPSIFGAGIVGATRDLTQLGSAGITRLTFDTPF